MSHYSNHFNKPWLKEGKEKITTDKIVRVCVVCKSEMMDGKFAYMRRKVCDDCKANKTVEEIKDAYREHGKYQRAKYEMIDAKNKKWKRHDEDRFIFQSPFRKKES